MADRVGLSGLGAGLRIRYQHHSSVVLGKWLLERSADSWASGRKDPPFRCHRRSLSLQEKAQAPPL